MKKTMSKYAIFHMINAVLFGGAFNYLSLALVAVCLVCAINWGLHYGSGQ